MPKISAILPVYNVEEYLKNCLRSIEEQSFKNFEVLLIDDCSTDNSLKILEEFAQKDSRFKVYKHKTNQKIATARNTGLNNASGDYIIFIDPDDWLEKNEFERVYNTFEETGADSIWFDYNFFQIKPPLFKQISAIQPALKKNCFFEINAINILNHPSFVWNKGFKRSCIENMNLRFTEGKWFEDVEFYFKFFTTYKKIYYINEALYYYRIRPKSFVHQSMEGNINLEDAFSMYFRLIEFAKENNFFEEYKITFIRQLARLIKSQKLPAIHDRIVDLAYETLQKIDFPNSFQN